MLLEVANWEINVVEKQQILAQVVTVMLSTSKLY